MFGYMSSKTVAIQFTLKSNTDFVNSLCPKIEKESSLDSHK